jgi:hypothetical protein
VHCWCMTSQGKHTRAVVAAAAAAVAFFTGSSSSYSSSSGCGRQQLSAQAPSQQVSGILSAAGQAAGPCRIVSQGWKGKRGLHCPG